MDSAKLDRLKSLNQSEAEVLEYLLSDPNFKVKDLCQLVHRGEGGVRTNLTAIFSKLRVPGEAENKREWVASEYSEVYEVFKRVESRPEIFIKPPDPIIEIPAAPIHFGEPILFYSDFDGLIDPQWIARGDAKTYNSHLGSPGVELVFGDHSWVNYAIYIRAEVYGSHLGLGKYNSFITVRNNQKKRFIAHTWVSGNVKETVIEDDEIRVFGNRSNMRAAIGKVSTDFPSLKIPKENDCGGIYISLNTGVYLDYLLVVKLP